MSTNFKSISISTTADFVRPTIPVYEENAFLHAKWVFKRQYPVASNFQFIGKPIIEDLPVHITFYLCDHVGADKKKAKNSTGTIDTTNVVSSVDNDQGSSSSQLEAMRRKKARITMKSSIKMGCTAKIIKYVMTDGTIHVEYHWDLLR
ncbi:uncharacterized protein RHIMIDRAFT_249899 [Rhizopus microsporus ATCC 52813]|uniref:Uncharacterized protein n=1 Tax=Rhizopus microsporus ATCC 52813 TaxID=1340429 RepID=A0A2G4T1W0_RHIZD|nr:uncharacterized protein RHIMIDRAFT_249899 [Rhizopus microsporus ATCC 52813]PHZ15001.1 hypothetical protein RHIMIDRAFT_249899 [Rhizopus microsporus ATCC 52813]